jgi:hypothetical protein
MHQQEIRFANQFDNDKIKELLIDFYNTYKHPLVADISKWSATHVDKVLANIYAGLGFVLIDKQATGLLVALKTPCMWIPETYQLQEGMWHGKTKAVKVKLLKEYLSIAKTWKLEGKIVEYYFNNYGNADFTKYNMKHIGKIWSS